MKSEGAADEAVLNNVHKNKNPKKFPFLTICKTYF